MKTSMSLTISLIMLLGILLTENNLLFAQGSSRWWQREILTPSTNQVINPSYLRKKRELEQAWDQLQRDMRAQEHFSKLGQDTSALHKAISSSRNKVRRLEYELSQIPSYITQIRHQNDSDSGWQRLQNAYDKRLQ